MTLALEEKYDQVRQLIAMGKERGYLLYDEVNDILPAEVHSSEEIDDLLSTFERYGIDVYEDLSTAKAALAAAPGAARRSPRRGRDRSPARAPSRPSAARHLAPARPGCPRAGSGRGAPDPRRDCVRW